MKDGETDTKSEGVAEEGRTDLYGTWAHKAQATQKSTVTLADFWIEHKAICNL